ncbi:MAG: MFS transporter [Clostridia bacterium]|nr:MFS transporter [Clostridia bacterium]
METVNEKRPFGMRDKVSYAAGDLGCNMSFALKSTIMFVFWTQFMQLGESLYATLLLVVQIWDAINDPLLGSLFDADKRKYKRGKFKTYIFIGAMGLVFSGLFFFLPLPNAPKVMRCIMFVLGYVLWDAFYTVANVPYGSMMSVITTDGSERSQLSTWRSIGSMVGNVLPMVLLPILCYDAADNLKGNTVFIAALVMGIIGLVCFIFMLKTTTIRVEENSVTISENSQKFNVFVAMKNFMKNPAAVGATLMAMAMFIGMQGSSSATTVLFQSYFGNAKISGIVMLIGYFPMFLFMPFIKKIVDRWGKKEACVVGSAVSVFGALLLFIPLGNEMAGLVGYVVSQVFFGFGLGFYTCVSWALMADAIDYNEWKNGTKEEGTVYSLHSFFRKLAQGLGPSLVVLIMGWLGYNGSLGADQPFEVAEKMKWLVAALYTFSAVVMFISITFIYNLNKKKVAEMTAELAARRGESVPVDEATTMAQILMGMEAAMDNDMEEEPPVSLPETANAEDDE